MKDTKILVTGPTSSVGLPVSLALAADNDVTGIARFGNAAAREQLEAAGVRCITVDLATSDFSEIEDEYDYVCNFAIARGGDADWDRDLAANGESVGLLMARCRSARAFLHCSSTAVYQPAGAHQLAETDPLGDNHRVMMPTYSLCKIAAEAVVRTQCRLLGLPTVITRLSVPYGDNGGWPWYHLMMMRAGAPIPVHRDGPSRYNLLHEDDMLRMLPRVLAQASVPATILNWGGSEATSIEEWTAWLAELTGLEAKLAPTDRTLRSVVLDPTRMHERVGRTQVPWKEGLRRMVAARNPELLRSPPR